MTTILETQNLTLHRGGVTVLDRVSLTAGEGRITAVVGPRRAGKSALLDLIAGQCRPDTGKVILRGRDLSGFDAAARARAGVARSFERAELFPGFGVEDHVLLALRGSRRFGAMLPRLAFSVRSERARAAEILDACGIGGHAGDAVTDLSLPERRRLEVAMLMAMAPVVCLCDAPTAGLTPKDTAEMLDLIATMSRVDGRTVLLTAHDMEGLDRMTDRLVIFEHGRVVADRAPPAPRQAAGPAATAETPDDRGLAYG